VVPANLHVHTNTILSLLLTLSPAGSGKPSAQLLGLAIGCSVGGFVVIICLFFLFRWASRVDDDPLKVRSGEGGGNQQVWWHACMSLLQQVQPYHLR
jgi:hypothetical protein